MKTKKFRGICTLPLASMIRARRESREFKKKYEGAFVDAIKCRARERIAQAETAMYASLTEWLYTYPLQASSAEDLAKWRERYKDFNAQMQKHRIEELKRLQVVEYSMNGRNYTTKVY